MLDGMASPHPASEGLGVFWKDRVSATESYAASLNKKVAELDAFYVSTWDKVAEKMASKLDREIMGDRASQPLHPGISCGCPSCRGL